MPHEKTIEDLERLKEERSKFDFFDVPQLRIDLIRENINQYWSTCPHCDTKYVTDEGHNCESYKK